MTSSSSNSRGSVARARAHLKPALVDGGQILGRGQLPRRKADELDCLAGFFARNGSMPAAQKCAGHDIVQHRHRPKRLCDLEGAGEAERADVVGFQADDVAAEGWKPSRCPAAEIR